MLLAQSHHVLQGCMTIKCVDTFIHADCEMLFSLELINHTQDAQVEFFIHLCASVLKYIRKRCEIIEVI